MAWRKGRQGLEEGDEDGTASATKKTQATVTATTRHITSAPEKRTATNGQQPRRRQWQDQRAEEGETRPEASAGGPHKSRVALSRPSPWWWQRPHRRGEAFQKTLGKVGSKGLFGPDKINPVGWDGARSLEIGQPDRRRKWGGTVRHHDQRNDGGGEDGLTHQRRQKRAGGGRGRGGYIQVPPPQIGEMGPGPPGGPEGPRQRGGGERTGTRGPVEGKPPRTRRLGKGNPGAPLGNQGLQGIRTDGNGQG